MDDREYLNYLQKQKDFEDEKRQLAKRVLDEVISALRLTPGNDVKLLEELAKSDDPIVAETAGDLLGDL